MERTTEELRKIVHEAEISYENEVELAQASILERYRTLSLAQTEYDEAKAEFDSNVKSGSTQAPMPVAVDLSKLSGYFVGNTNYCNDGWNSTPYFSLKRSEFEARIEPKPNQDTISRISMGKPSRELLRLAVKPPFHWREVTRKALGQAVNGVARTMCVNAKEEAVVRGWTSREWNAVRARGGKKLARFTADELMCRYVNVDAPWVRNTSGKRKWGEAEETKLENIRNNAKEQTSWVKVAQLLNTGRSPMECFRKVIEMEDDGSLWKVGSWDEAETTRLISLVDQYGRSNWNTISLILGNRTASACRSRYEKRLNPSTKKGRWTTAEDSQLSDAIEKIGEMNWSKIEALVPGRTDVQCRERYRSAGFQKLARYQRWNWREDCLLLVLRNSNGNTNWDHIEATFRGRRSLKECQKRWRRMVKYKEEFIATGERRYHMRNSFSASAGWYTQRDATSGEIEKYIEAGAKPVSFVFSTVAAADIEIESASGSENNAEISPVEPSGEKRLLEDTDTGRGGKRARHKES